MYTAVELRLYYDTFSSPGFRHITGGDRWEAELDKRVGQSRWNPAGQARREEAGCCGDCKADSSLTFGPRS